MVALERNRDHSVIFIIATKYCTLDSFCDYEGYSIFSQGFLPSIVDTVVIWIKFTHSSPFNSLIPKMSMFTFAISCLTTSNLFYFHHQSHPKLGILFALAQSLHSFWSSFSSLLQEHLLTCGVHLSVSYLFAFSYCSWGPQGKSAVLSGLSTMTHPSQMALNSMVHSFIKLHKAVIHVIILVSFLWLWFSLCLPFDE